MAGKYLTSPIPPFPAELDRKHFGSWLSGFVDGEGHFGLTIRKKKPTLILRPDCIFKIEQRQDDIGILSTIQSFFQCGIITRFRHENSKVPNAKPTALYAIGSIPALMSVVIPHFVAFPLWSKKARDFLIWREGVELAYAVSQKERRGRIGQPGGKPKWTTDDLEKYVALAAKLSEQRKFNASLIPPLKRLVDEPGGLFDGLDRAQD